jgi:hypothetical protein
MSRWVLPVPESPEQDQLLGGVDPRPGREDGEGGGDAGDAVGFEVGQPVAPREAGFGHAAGPAAAGAVVYLGGQDLCEVAQVGVPFPDGDVGEPGGVSADGRQFQLAGGGARMPPACLYRLSRTWSSMEC